ncbi:MAG: glycosyltransferase family 4 protein [Lutibacter sp.]|uniref:glycosyltransferase family 4 protein n=1 Tax=Lutibacter sp. TaxID=1925666 RepID=UPI0017A6D57E|nr:glycosyltransferase family 4 protein [Lutibacter sp.]MBT8318069.1 glycosyltransferase family 4 protein [Lutibacter sp.]NNJ58929.1 glycosyltransferase family 4 protein [Lutibacter sp.]
MKIVFSSNISWSIYNFRTPLLKALQKNGHEIYTVAFKDEYAHKLVNEGFHFEAINLNNNATNPLEDLKTIYNYYKIYKKINPEIICHNAIKPNIYGTIAASMLGIPTINNISGLGTLFIKKSFSTKIAKWLYRYSQKKATKVFFQNNADLELFVKNNLVDKVKCQVIPGSGVNTVKFKPKENRNGTDNFQFLFVGRLLYDKGIREYIDAVRMLKAKYPKTNFAILGPLYKNNATAISEETLNSWISEDIIDYLGQSDAVQEVLNNAQCVVLPSYREGLSKVLIEASSMSIPIVTTNVPGCRDVVLNDETGFLCKVKNGEDLANKMEKMLLLPDEERKIMGMKARERAIAIFDEKIIIKHYIEAINAIV